MAVVALIISILALLAAAASAWYARVQAHAATAATNLARTPVYSAEIKDVNEDGGFYRLDLVLTAPEPMDRVVVRIPDQAGVRFTSSQAGVTPGGKRCVAESYEGEITPGETVCWRVELDPENYVEEIRLQVESHRDEATWWTQVPAAVPYVGPYVY